MPQYVEDACDQCGCMVPRNELQDVSRRVVVGGTSGTMRTYSKGGLGFTSGRTDYRIERLRLCRTCMAVWLEAQRVRRRSAILGVSFAFLILLGVIVAIVVAAKTNSPAIGSGANATDSTLNVNTIATDSADETAANTSDAVPPSDQSATNEDVPPAPPPAQADSNVAPTPENTPALSQAISSALEGGATTPWQSGTHTGQVTVGDERFYNGKPCRSFIYTVDATPAPTAYACAGVDGVWRPTSDFAVKGLY